MSISDQLNMEQEQLSEIEKKAVKWIEETDVEQFSQMELLSMFAESQNKELTEQLEKESGKWSVDEIIEELKNIDAFGAAKYFFDKFNPNPYDES